MEAEEQENPGKEKDKPSHALEKAARIKAGKDRHIT